MPGSSSSPSDTQPVSYIAWRKSKSGMWAAIPGVSGRTQSEVLEQLMSDELTCRMSEPMRQSTSDTSRAKVLILPQGETPK